MEKTTNIVLGGIRFDMTEEAFRMLDAYLLSLAAHFESDPDKAEIIRDIEGRIAEKFSESNGVITSATVSDVLEQMGTPEDISSEPGESADLASRKLYRDPDTAILAGVGSGIAVYLGIDPIIVRLAFLASVFLGGFGVVLYLLLWLLIPQARTASQKLEMRGSAVTLGSVADLIRDRSNEITANGFLKRLIYFPFEILAAVVRGGRSFLPWGRKLLGILLCLTSFLAILSITGFALFAVTNMGASYIELPLLEAVSASVLYFLIAAYYVTALIPFILLFVWGQRLLRTRVRMASTVGFGLIGLWSLAVITSGVLTFNVVSSYNEYLETAPAYQQVTQSIEGNFSTIRATGDVEIKLSNGPVLEASIAGYQHDLERAVYTVEDGVLTIESRPMPGNCIFCDTDDLIVTVVSPDVDAIELTRSSLSLDKFVTDSLEIEGDRARITGTIETARLSLMAVASSITLSGSATEGTFSLERANLSATTLEVRNAAFELRNYSRAEAWVSDTAQVYAEDGSEISYRGAPNVIEDTSR